HDTLPDARDRGEEEKDEDYPIAWHQTQPVPPFAPDGEPGRGGRLRARETDGALRSRVRADRPDHHRRDEEGGGVDDDDAAQAQEGEDETADRRADEPGQVVAHRGQG